MKAYVVKTKFGYVGYAGTKHKLNEAFLYPNKKSAREDCLREDDKIIPVKINEVKK